MNASLKPFVDLTQNTMPHFQDSEYSHGHRTREPRKRSWPPVVADHEIPAAPFAAPASVMEPGTVKFFNTEKGFGFITPDNASGDVFVHVTVLRRSGLETLVKDQRVFFERGPGKPPGREQATKLRLG